LQSKSVPHDSQSTTRDLEGEHVLVRVEEHEGFTTKAMVLAGSVDVSKEVEQHVARSGNSLVAMSASNAFTVVQANGADIQLRQPSATEWANFPAFVVQELRALQKSGSDHVVFGETLVSAAPFLLGNVDVNIADAQWLLDALKLVAHPQDESAQKNPALLPVSLRAARILAAEPARRRKEAAERLRQEARRREAEKAVARSQVLPLPACVNRMFAADYTYISNDHRDLIKACVPWTIKALKYAHLDEEISRHVRLLLGIFQFTQCLSWAQPAWNDLRDGVEKEMTEIGPLFT